MYACICMYMYACVYMHVYVCMYMYVCICMCVCMCVYVCVYVCMYVYVCVCIHVYVCMHNILGGNYPGEMSYPKREGNCPEWNCPGGIVRGNCPGGNCPTPATPRGRHSQGAYKNIRCCSAAVVYRPPGDAVRQNIYGRRCSAGIYEGDAGSGNPYEWRPLGSLKR